MTRYRTCAVLCGLAMLAAVAPGAAQMRPADQALLKPDPKNWPTYSGSYNSQRFSSLSQVTAANAKNLEAKWVYHFSGMRDLETVPIVMNGVMYVSQFNRVDALDARTGNVIWKYQRQPVSTAWQRGTAVYGNKVYLVTADSHLVALDARNGAVLWDVKSNGGMILAGGAPLVAYGKVIVSGNKPDGFIQAYDAETGKYVWTWSPIPQPGDPALASWGGAPPNGMPIWVSGSYDPEQNLIFYGTGQPEPQWVGKQRPGDDLYSDSVVALDVDTGKLKWYFQFTSHDTHDYDALEMPVLVDAIYQGKPRKLLLQANRNGFYYVLDRMTGKFLAGTPFVSKIDWASGLDPNGKAILNPGHDPSVKGMTTCPSTAGATNWPSPTYDPQTKYFYLVMAEGCGINTVASSAPGAGTGYNESPNEPWQAYVIALDAFTGKKMWSYRAVRSNHYGPGLVSTAGGIVFAPEQLGEVTVLDALNGKPLWHFNTGDLITASPIAYSVDGRQYFAIASNTNIFAFGLPDAASGSAP
jgi:alcohol dehydrogenase (cytochrome c)